MLRGSYRPFCVIPLHVPSLQPQVFLSLTSPLPPTKRKKKSIVHVVLHALSIRQNHFIAFTHQITLANNFSIQLFYIFWLSRNNAYVKNFEVIEHNSQNTIAIKVLSLRINFGGILSPQSKTEKLYTVWPVILVYVKFDNFETKKYIRKKFGISNLVDGKWYTKFLSQE